jgi:hypothetical protein
MNEAWVKAVGGGYGVGVGAGVDGFGRLAGVSAGDDQFAGGAIATLNG